MTSPVGSKDYFHTLFAVKLKVVKMGPRLHIVKLCYSAVNIYCRDDDVCIICVLAETVSRGDRAEISCGDNVCGSDGGPLDMLADISHTVLTFDHGILGAV